MNKAYSKLVFVNNQSPDLDADNLNSISNAIDTIDDRVIALDGKATTDEGNISTLQSNVSTLQSNMTTANTNIATNTADIADLKAKTTNVSVSQTLTSGVEIGKITVDNVPTTLYAPDDSGNTTFKDVTKAEYDALPSSKLTDGIAYMVSGLDPMDAYNIPYKNTTVGNKLDNGGSSGAEFYNITQADYDALPSSKLTDGVAYVITDADDMDAYNMPYKNTTVGDGLDSLYSPVISPVNFTISVSSVNIGIVQIGKIVIIQGYFKAEETPSYWSPIITNLPIPKRISNSLPTSMPVNVINVTYASKNTKLFFKCSPDSTTGSIYVLSEDMVTSGSTYGLNFIYVCE